MNTAVHNTASLADVLLADGASAGKSADDDRDKTNTVDFGATLTSFIDQTAAGKTPPGSGLATSSPSVRGKHSADAPTAFDSRTQDAPTSFDWSARNALTAALDSASADPPTTSDPSAADAPKTSGPSATVTPTAFDISTAAHVNGHFSKVAGTPKVGSKAPATVQTQEVGTQTSNARSDSLAALLDDRTVATHPRDVAADESSLHQINTSASTGAAGTGKTSAGDASATRTSDGVTTGDPAGQSAELAMVAQSGVAAMVDSPVAGSDIALAKKSQPSSPKASGDSASASSAQVTSSANKFANVANPAQIDADADLRITATPRTTDSAHSHSGRESGGTSPALSTQSANSDSMNPADPKITQQVFAKLAADATTSSAQWSSQTQTDAVAQTAPQDQRARNGNTKETSSQPADASGLANDPAHGADPQPASPAPEVAAIRLTPQVTSPSESSRTVSITVQLAGGQTAQASVREHAGAVDVKILTPTAASAQRVSSEMDGMRQNLDAAGIKLGHSEISYQQGDGGGQGREGYRPPAQNQSANGKEVFVMNEVLQ